MPLSDRKHTLTHTLAQWAESNGPVPGGNRFFFAVHAVAHAHSSKRGPSLFDVTSPLDFQWARLP